jgi:hypothetical protein
MGGYGDAGGGAVQQGNAVKWVYMRPGGGSLEFWINEDGRVAQIAATGRTGSARTSKGVQLGSGYSQVMKAYGVPETHRTSPVPPEVATVLGLGKNQRKDAARQARTAAYAAYYGVGPQSTSVNDLIYTRKHHVAFTTLEGKVARITIALTD